MTGHDPGDRRRAADYRTARISAAAALVGVVVIMLLADAISVTYDTSPLVLGIVLGTAAALMGVELRTPGNGG